MTDTMDFGRSFATFVTPGRTNHARIQVEAVCEMAGGERFVLAASCKAENTYAPENLFKQPNYDFCAIFSEDEYCIVRVGLPVTACWRDAGLNAARFEEVRIDLVQTPAEICGDAQAVVSATVDGRPLVGRSEVLGEAGETLATLEYPIRTMNVNDAEHSPDGDWIYQVDTGPIIAPDAQRRVEYEVERMDLAFIAWNAPDGAEFITLTPTPVNHSDDCAGHYSAVRTAAARNSVLAAR